MSDKSCLERVEAEYASTMEDIRTLWNLYLEDPEAYDDDLGRFDEYGLGWDFVEPHTFRDQPDGYFRWQISWGGPSHEFRFDTQTIHDPYPGVAFWFLDWFDGAHVNVRGEDLKLLHEIWDSQRELLEEPDPGEWEYETPDYEDDEEDEE